jgi:rhomboid protease GluP
MDYSPTPTNPEAEQAAPVSPVTSTMPQTRPLVTYTFIVINVLVFLLQQLRPDLVTEAGLKVNEYIVQGEYWRLFTPMFLHGGIIHLGFNLYALYIFGPGLERHFGHLRFITLFILSGFAGNVLSFMFSAAPSLGSSTAIFGLLGAEGVFLYRNRRIFGGQARRALNNLIILAAINLIFGFSSPGIDNWGHLGGLLGGTLFAWLGGPILAVKNDYPGISVVDTREPRDAFVAALIDLIIFGGLAALTIFMRGS